MGGCKNERCLQRRCLTFSPLFWVAAVAVAVRQRHGATTESIGWQEEGGVKGVKAERGRNAASLTSRVHFSSQKRTATFSYIRQKGMRNLRVRYYV